MSGTAFLAELSVDPVAVDYRQFCPQRVTHHVDESRFATGDTTCQSQYPQLFDSISDEVHHEAGHEGGQERVDMREDQFCDQELDRERCTLTTKGNRKTTTCGWIHPLAWMRE